MANPLTPQGVLNKARGSIQLANFPFLNVGVGNLGQAGISLAFGGPATTGLPTLTGAVLSPELYQVATLRVNLLKTQNLANLYKRKLETNSILGDLTVYPDVVTGGISSYPITNCGLGDLETLSFNGTDAGWIVSIFGYYLINNELFGA